MRNHDSTHGLKYALYAMLAMLLIALALPDAKAASESCDGPCVCTLSCEATGQPPIVPPPYTPPPVVPPPVTPPPGTCSATLPVDRTTWARVFENPFPDRPGYPVNIGSSLTRKPVAGRVLAIQFTASEMLSLRWTHAQRGPYGASDGVVFSISRCAGDVNAPGPCRKYGPEGSIFGLPGSGSYNACGLTRGATYYLNVQFADPQGRNTCLSGTSCDVAVQ